MPFHNCKGQQGNFPHLGDCDLLMSAYILAGLAMMLNIRLLYSSAPYALIRFRLPENLFSVFVRRMASALELWCLPGFVVINIMDFARKPTGKQWHDWYYHWQSIVVQWLNFVTFVILWISFIIGGEQGNVTAFYWVMAASGFVFGINMVMVYAIDWNYIPIYMIGENSFPMVTSFMHYVGTLFFGNRRKWNSDYLIVYIDIIVAIIISLVAAIVWTIAYHSGKGDDFSSDNKQKDCTNITLNKSSGTTTEYTIESGNKEHLAATGAGKCGHKGGAYYAYFIPPTLMVIVGMGLVYAIYPAIAPGMIVPFYLIDKIEMVLLIATTVPPIVIGILKNYDINPYVYMGNWGKYHRKVCKGGNTPSDLGVCSGTIVATLNAQISGATLNTSSSPSLDLTLNPAGAKIAVEGDTAASDNSNGEYILATGTLKVTGITLSGSGDESNPYTVTDIGTLKANDLKLQSGTGKIKQNTLITLKLSNPNEEGVTLTVTSVTLNTSTPQPITTNPDTNSELHSSHTTDKCCIFGSQNTWKLQPAMYTWHAFTILAPFQICLAGIFTHCLHYPDSNISRSIVDQPKMSTFLSIMFYMCHGSHLDQR